MTANLPGVPPPIPASHSEPFQPVSSGDRIETLDILRGVGLFGILLVNIALFSQPIYSLMLRESPPGTQLDKVAEWLVAFLAEGKFYPLFSFLFGMGAGLQMERSAAHNTKFGGLFSRRLLTLLAFGLLHAFLVWEGDILTLYAILGFILMAFQGRRPKTLLIWSGLCLLLPLLIFAGIWLLLSLASLVPEAASQIKEAFEAERATDQRLAQKNLQIFSEGTWGQIFVQRGQNVMAMWRYTWFFGPTCFAMFLLGIYASQRQLLKRIEANRAFIFRVAIYGFALGLPVNLFYAMSIGIADPLAADLTSFLQTMALSLGGPALSLGYAAGLTLLAQRAVWKRLLYPVAAAGRMALTNYLLQSLVCTTIFYSYGLGWYGSTGRAAGLVLVVLIYAGQLPLSVWWLKRFRFGPAEWVWRSCAYAKLQSFRSC